MPYFAYAPEDLAVLKSRDKKLGALIDRMGPIQREVEPGNTFQSLVTGIVSQQISGKAAQTVCLRLRELAGDISPRKMAALSAEDIQKCGMSMRKASTIRGIVDAAVTGMVAFDGMDRLPDGEIIGRLTALPGVGVWTAEMLLLFSLGRRDIFSCGDFGIRKGLMRLYGHKEITKERFERYRKRYSPYGSLASLYLWELAGEPD